MDYTTNFLFFRPILSREIQRARESVEDVK